MGRKSLWKFYKNNEHVVRPNKDNNQAPGETVGDWVKTKRREMRTTMERRGYNGTKSGDPGQWQNRED